MNTATLLLTLLFAGLSSQWLAWRFQVPAIVVLITVGLILGPVTGFIAPGMSPHDLSEMIGLGVAIILFEGGMDLKLEEFRRAGKGIRRLTLLGPPLAWVFGSFAAHHIAGLSWPVASVLGAILVVTGPTVILPLLRQVRLNKESASLLKWEGIVNDPSAFCSPYWHSSISRLPAVAGLKPSPVSVWRWPSWSFSVVVAVG